MNRRDRPWPPDFEAQDARRKTLRQAAREVSAVTGKSFGEILPVLVEADLLARQPREPVSPVDVSLELSLHQGQIALEMLGQVEALPDHLSPEEWEAAVCDLLRADIDAPAG